ALPDGRLASSGGRVVKNVSGYDLNKLHLGALGACGVVVAASFKVFPRPLHEVTVSSDGGWAEAERALRLALPPVALELSDSGRLVARLAGSETAVKRTAAELGWTESDPGFWAEHAARTSDAWARVSVPAGALPEVLAELPARAGWWASPRVGVAPWFAAHAPGSTSRARNAAAPAGGAVVLRAARAAALPGRAGSAHRPLPRLPDLRSRLPIRRALRAHHRARAGRGRAPALQAHPAGRHPGPGAGRDAGAAPPPRAPARSRPLN